MEITKYEGRFMKVTEELIEGNNWERCYLRNGVIIYAIDNDNKFIMINEKRPHETEKVRLRFVAGHLEDGLSVIENANKELREEIGLFSNHIEEFFELKTSGTINNSVHFVIARNLIVDPNPIPNPDGDVILSIERFTFDELYQKIIKDELRWSTAVMGFLRLHHLNLLKK
jgi:8-oxo-dGTP pyrophosphatase MutT (NUDIX family)